MQFLYTQNEKAPRGPIALNAKQVSDFARLPQVIKERLVDVYNLPAQKKMVDARRAGQVVPVAAPTTAPAGMASTAANPKYF